MYWKARHRDGSLAALIGTREAREQIADVLRRWTNSPDRFTKVAEYLAWLVSRHADTHHGADGWWNITEPWSLSEEPATDAEPVGVLDVDDDLDDEFDEELDDEFRDEDVFNADLRACYGLLCSQSEHFDTSMI